MAKIFEEKSEAALLGLIRHKPLGSIVYSMNNELGAQHIPFLERLESHSALHAHVPRSSPLAELDGAPCLIIFSGDDGYITPSWYATKKEHGKVVPTWNYAVAHVKGRIKLHDNARWIKDQIAALTDQFEQHRAAPWTMDDAPKAYTDRLLKALIGLEIEVTSVSGITKASQNQPDVNQQSVLAGLARERPESGLTTWMQRQIGEKA